MTGTDGEAARTCKCGQPARPGQRNCRECRNASMRASRPAYRELTADERARSNARGKARHAERTGKLTRKPCEWGSRPGEDVGGGRSVCGVLEVQRHHDDYDKPLEVRYLCGVHHPLADAKRKPTQRALELV